MYKLRKYLISIFDITANSDFEATKSIISDGVEMKGFNLWILICSTVLASIGLDTNSTAVIIGAMLISPLMSPILGVGLSLATHDRILLLRSSRNLFFSILLSFLVSLMYFLVSPLSAETEELKARTFPTLLDVLIALFGGIAGIVSISRHQPTNAIPGVAIATALMPPLCTAGFGMATQNWPFFFGSLYLFFINTVFIGVATYIIGSHLHFPGKKFINKNVEIKYRFWITLIGMIILAPSIYFLYSTYNVQLVRKEIEKYVIMPIKNQGNVVMKWELEKNDSGFNIKVYHSGNTLSDSIKSSIKASLKKNKMVNYQLKPLRINVSREEISKLSAATTLKLIENMKIESLNNRDENKDEKYRNDSLSESKLINLSKIAFPFIDSLYIGKAIIKSLSKKDTITEIFYKTKYPISKNKIISFNKFLKTLSSSDSIITINF